jgi:hypothetical protein
VAPERVDLRSTVTVSGRNRAVRSSGPNTRIPASTPLSRIGASRISPRTRSGAIAAVSSATFAPRDVPPKTAWAAPTWSRSATTCSANAVTE